MKKDEFLSRLTEQLPQLKQSEIDQLREYYQELICDGLEQGRTEENIIEGFGKPEDLAVQIKNEYKEYAQILMPRQTEQNQQDYTTRSPITKVLVEAQNLRVEIRQVPAGTVRVLFQPREGVDEVIHTVDNGEFIFRHRMRIFPLNIVNWFRFPQRLILEIPENFRGSMRVKTSNSQINAASLPGMADIQLITSNAKITAENMSAGTMLLQSSNGGLLLRDLKGRRLEAITSNEKVRAANCSFPDTLLLSTKNGSIFLQDIIGDNIVLTTSNASITGNILGDMRDYGIESKTSNASNNLPNYQYPDQRKHLKARTSNGKIMVEFRIV